MHHQFNRAVLRPEFLIEMCDVVEDAALDLLVAGVEVYDDTVRLILSTFHGRAGSPKPIHEATTLREARTLMREGST